MKLEMNNIIYTSKAKDDLARINWKIRERIINVISHSARKNPFQIGFKQISDTNLLKLTYDEHIIIGRVEEKELSIITIQKKKEIRVPE